MKNPSMRLMTAMVCICMISIAVPQTLPKPEPKTRAIIGCLVRGDNQGDIWLAEMNGAIYALESTKMNLTIHLGQRVRIIGYVLAENKEPAKDTKTKPGLGIDEMTVFRVSTLKTISTTCRHQ